jgi:inosine-uridine nucleoside N-ribohydrolase
MGPDYDDVGAITILYALAAKDECKILATMASDGYPYIAPTLEVFNRYFGHPEIPIGVPGAGAPAFSSSNHWNDSLAVKFLPKLKTNKDYPSAIEVYRKVLATQKDQSVVIVTVGFLSNLSALLQSGPDQYSPLDGKHLVAKKVKNGWRWVAVFPKEMSLISISMLLLQYM